MTMRMRRRGVTVRMVLSIFYVSVVSPFPVTGTPSLVLWLLAFSLNHSPFAIVNLARLVSFRSRFSFLTSCSCPIS